MICDTNFYLPVDNFIKMLYIDYKKGGCIMYLKDKTCEIHTRITEEQYQMLLKLARLTGLTISAVLQSILQTYCEASEEL